jgi:hypothetical protein
MQAQVHFEELQVTAPDTTDERRPCAPDFSFVPTREHLGTFGTDSSQADELEKANLTYNHHAEMRKIVHRFEIASAKRRLMLPAQLVESEPAIPNAGLPAPAIYSRRKARPLPREK